MRLRRVQRAEGGGKTAAYPTASSPAGRQQKGLTSGDGLLLHVHDGIPPYAEAELDRLYGSFYSSLAHIEIEVSTRGVQTYVTRRGDQIIDLLLFRIEGRQVYVLNEAITIDAEAVRRFADVMFGMHDDLDAIHFHAVQPALSGLQLPHQRFHCSDDSVLKLPATVDAYVDGLGKATRKNLRRALSRLNAHYPNFRYDVYERESVPEVVVTTIIAMNRARMAAKGKANGIDDAQAQRILALVRRCGLVGIATVGERICAGAIVFQAGKHYFSFVRAHDPAFNDYRLGLVGAYHLVRSCIARRGDQLHFMWGREPHKALLGGEHIALEHVIVFRSWPRMLRHFRPVAKTATASFTHSARSWLVDKARKNDGLSAHLLGFALAALRALRNRLRMWRDDAERTED